MDKNPMKPEPKSTQPSNPTQKGPFESGQQQKGKEGLKTGTQRSDNGKNKPFVQTTTGNTQPSGSKVQTPGSSSKY